jgi:hypothetical protein
MTDPMTDPTTPRGSSGVVEQSATQRKHEYHSERTDFDFWCIASCHDDGRCDGECDPDCESCPIPCPLCEAAAPTPSPADESAEGLRAWEYVKQRLGDLLVEESERSRTTFLYLRVSDVQEVIRDGDSLFSELAAARKEGHRE